MIGVSVRLRHGLLWALLLSPTPAAGQSVLAAAGLGVPMDPVDARGRALGSVGPGMFGTGLIPSDPGASLDLAIPTGTMSIQSAWLAIDQPGRPTNPSGNRFPALGVSYPVQNLGVLTVTYGGVLDQRWRLERKQVVDLGELEVPVTDVFVSTGGVSAVRLGFARRLSGTLGVGAALGAYTGNVERRLTRGFDSLVVEVSVPPFESGGRWTYSGLTGTVGVVLDLGDLLRAGGTLTLSSALEAEPSEDEQGQAQSYDMPAELRAGLSASLATDLTAALSVAYVDWSTTAAGVRAGTTASSALTLGAGLQWEGASFLGRSLPIRMGWRRVELPFYFADRQPVETAFAGGLGILLLASTDALPLAQVDVALERGSRLGGEVTERFWRSTVSLRIAGF